MSSLVSCLVPAFNAAPFIAEALDSILAQTYPSIEAIVIDDGSTDATADVARRHGSAIRVIGQERGGLMSAREAAVEAASGEFVAFLDADDLWVNTKVEQQVAVFHARPSTDLCVSQFINFWEDPVAAGTYAGHPLSQPQAGYAAGTLMARRSLFRDIDGYQSVRSDTEWFARAVQQGCEVYTIPEVLMRRRIHSSNISVLDGTSLKGIFDLIRVRREDKRDSTEGR